MIKINIYVHVKYIKCFNPVGKILEKQSEGVRFLLIRHIVLLFPCYNNKIKRYVLTDLHNSFAMYDDFKIPACNLIFRIVQASADSLVRSYAFEIPVFI